LFEKKKNTHTYTRRIREFQNKEKGNQKKDMRKKNGHHLYVSIHKYVSLFISWHKLEKGMYFIKLQMKEK